MRSFKQWRKAYQRQYRANNRERYRNSLNKFRYGITTEERDALLAEQDGRCSICLIAIEFPQARVDHDHATSKVRGILCHHCNTGLGNFRDKMLNLQRAIDV